MPDIFARLKFHNSETFDIYHGVIHFVEIQIPQEIHQITYIAKLSGFTVLYFYSTTSSTASSCDTEWSKEDEQRLRDYILQLKNDRAAVRLTVMELESVHFNSLSTETMPSVDNQKLDLENAVLMQELTALKVGFLS